MGEDKPSVLPKVGNSTVLMLCMSTAPENESEDDDVCTVFDDEGPILTLPTESLEMIGMRSNVHRWACPPS